MHVSSGVIKGHLAIPHRVANPIFTKNLQAQCMDVWCEAFCCGHINFKTVFQSAAEHVIFIQKIEKHPLPRPTLSGRGNSLLNHSAPTAPRPSRFRRSTLAPFPKSQIRHCTLRAEMHLYIRQLEGKCILLMPSIHTD